MMQISEAILREIYILGTAVLSGALLFFCYDSLRIFRRVIPHDVFWISVEDLIYWLLVTIVVFVMLYQTDDGMIRGFSLGGIGLGAGIYYFLLSRHLVRFFTFLFRKIKYGIGKILRFFFSPFLHVMRKILHKIKKELKKRSEAVKIKRKNERKR